MSNSTVNHPKPDDAAKKASGNFMYPVKFHPATRPNTPEESTARDWTDSEIEKFIKDSFWRDVRVAATTTSSGPSVDMFAGGHITYRVPNTHPLWGLKRNGLNAPPQAEAPQTEAAVHAQTAMAKLTEMEKKAALKYSRVIVGQRDAPSKYAVFHSVPGQLKEAVKASVELSCGFILNIHG